MKMTGGEAIVATILSHGIDTIFGLPGAQNDWFYNALFDADGAVRIVHTRHEQGAGYMALGYAMSTGKTGLYSVVPGVGMLNASAALATAYSVGAPVVCFTGQIPSHSIGRGYGQLHELPDQMGILERLTKWAESIESPAQASPIMAEAFRQLRSGRIQPVAVECPMDVLAARGEVKEILSPLAIEHPAVDEDAIDEAAKLLGSAKNPLIFVGSGALGAREAVQELAEALQAPVIANRSGHGILPSSHYLSARMPVGHALWERADVVIALGSRLQRPLQMWGTDDELKVVRIDIDPEEHYRINRPDVGVIARCEEAVPLLVKALGKYNSVRPSREEEMNDLQAEIDGRMAYMDYQLAHLGAIRDVLPEDGFLVNDVTQLGFVSPMVFPTEHPRTIISPGYQGTLGWGFATALGVQVANPDKNVVAICGDGGFMFTMPELATAVQHGINLVTIVFTDGAYGNVKRMQKENYGGKFIASDLRNPDFAAMAETFGAQGLKADGPDELRSALEKGFAFDGPTIIEVPQGEIPSPWPMVMPPKVRG